MEVGWFCYFLFVCGGLFGCVGYLLVYCGVGRWLMSVGLFL